MTDFHKSRDRLMSGTGEELGMAQRDHGRWCILRTSAARTLPLALSLVAAGLEAWTPTQAVSRRVPRSKAKREIDVPVMPTFVFARAVHIDALVLARSMPVNPHPAFSIFRYLGRIPLLDDREMESLRAVERRAVPASKRPSFRKGERVSAPGGAFTGMSGVVEDGDGRYALVSFGGKVSVKIATFLLRSDDVQGQQALVVAAA